MFLRILTILNTIISLAVVGFAGFVIFMYGNSIVSNFPYYMNLNQLSQDVELVTNEIVREKLDNSNTLVLRENVPYGFVDVEGYVTVQEESGEAILLFGEENVSDPDLLKFAVPMEEKTYSVRIGCDIETGLRGTPVLNISGDTYNSLIAATNEAPVNVRLAFGYGQLDGECASSVAAVQLVTADVSDDTKESAPEEAEESESAE